MQLEAEKGDYGAHGAFQATLSGDPTHDGSLGLGGVASLTECRRTLLVTARPNEAANLTDLGLPRGYCDY